MRAKLFFLCACLLAGSLGGYAISTQRARTQAHVVYLKIAPIDPRALLSGDYMELSYDFENLSRPWERKESLTLYADKNGVVHVNGTGKPLTLRTHFMRYRLPHQFYFQEGQGKKYENAAYAKAAVLPNGSILLLGLTDENLNVL